MNDDIRILKSGTCPSLSGKSKLGYEIGCGPASDIHVRICRNSGTGYFSKDWIAWVFVQGALAKGAGGPITSHTLSPLFQGQSINTAGFLLAVMKHEGLVQPMPEKPRCYELLDGSQFFSAIEALMGSPVATPKKTRAAKTTGPAAAAATKKIVALPRTPKR